jgi:hypothetical protein
MQSQASRHAAMARVLWIGGAQWAGKTSVAQLLAVRHPVLHYSYDYHDARSHAHRSRSQPDRYPYRHALLTALDRDPDIVWVMPTPQQMAEDAQHQFAERFEMVLDDLFALPDGATVIAEGWGLRPDLVAPWLTSPAQAVFLVPTEDFLARQLQMVPRAMSFNPETRVSDPERAQRNRLARNQLLAQDVIDSANRLGLRVIMVDGTQGVEGLAELVEVQLRPFLPPWRY